MWRVRWLLHFLAWFFISRQFHYLFSSAAFFLLSAGQAVQAFHDLQSGKPVASDWPVTLSWLFATALLWASVSSATSRRSANSSFSRAYLAVSVASTLCILVAVFLWLTRLPNVFEGNTWITTNVDIASLAIMTVTMIESYGYWQASWSPAGGLACYFFVSCIAVLFSSHVPAAIRRVVDSRKYLVDGGMVLADMRSGQLGGLVVKEKHGTSWRNRTR